MARSPHRPTRRRAAEDPVVGEPVVAEPAVVGDPAVAEPAVVGEPAVDGAGERQVWCDTCEVMIPIGDLDEDDCCPTCGEPVGPRRVPWKFRLMIGASVIYLGYRAYQGIEWVAHHL